MGAWYLVARGPLAQLASTSPKHLLLAGTEFARTAQQVSILQARILRAAPPVRLASTLHALAVLGRVRAGPRAQLAGTTRSHRPQPGIVFALPAQLASTPALSIWQAVQRALQAGMLAVHTPQHARIVVPDATTRTQPSPPDLPVWHVALAIITPVAAQAVQLAQLATTPMRWQILPVCLVPLASTKMPRLRPHAKPAQQADIIPTLPKVVC